MKEHPFRAIPLWWTVPVAAVLTACMVVVICCPPSALAADRTVLCEEFTNKW